MPILAHPHSVYISFTETHYLFSKQELNKAGGHEGYFQCSLIVEGEPLYLANLLQPGRMASNYVCGKCGGIRFELQ